MRRRPLSRELPLPLLLALAILPGCRSLLPPLRVPGISSEVTEADLHADVLELVNRFSAGVTAAADQIAATAPERRVRRRALLWKVRMIPLVQQTAFSPAREGYVELIVVCTAQRQYLTEGAGRELFGAQQEIARSVAQQLETDAHGYSQRFLGPERAKSLEAEAEELAAEQPIQGEFVAAGLQRAFADIAPGGDFGWVFALPMAPFTAIEGVESSAQAIHEFNSTARQLGDLAARLPELARWQMELLLYDLEDRETVVRSLSSFEQLSSSADRFSLAAERLPAATREELSALLAESDSAQDELRSTLDSLRQAAAGVDGTLAKAAPLLEALDRVAGHASEAGSSWSELVARLRTPSAEPSSGRPFDVTEYERTAAGVRDAAAELRALVEAVRAGQASIADALFWRGLALIGAGFGLALVYRALVARLFSTRSRGAG